MCPQRGRSPTRINFNLTHSGKTGTFAGVLKQDIPSLDGVTPNLYCTRPRMILTRSASEGRSMFPRLRFGLVWNGSLQVARSINRLVGSPRACTKVKH